MFRTCGVSRIAIAAGILTAGGTAIAVYLYNERKNRNTVPTEWSVVGKVEKLYIYPLKSGRRIQLSEAECTNKGLMEVGKLPGSFKLRDRAFVVYHPENFEYRTARVHPKMVLISVESWENEGAVFKAPGLQDLNQKIPQVEPAKIVYIRHYRDEKIRGIDCGDEAAKWISTCLLEKDTGLRMAYFDDTFDRNQISELYKDLPYVTERGLRNESAGLNSDLSAVMLVNAASSREIINVIGDPEITTDYFRPNIIVSGPNLMPYAEDQWKWIKVGDTVLKNVGDCIRCVMSTVNMETGERRSDREPLKTLERLRGVGPGNTPLMGIMLEVNQTGLISGGDIVYVGK